MGKTDYGADEDGVVWGGGEVFGCGEDMGGLDAGGGDIVCCGKGETGVHGRVGEGGVEEGVVNHLCESMDGDVGKGD